MTSRYRAEPPWIGPILVQGEGPWPDLSMGADPQLGNPDFICMVPVCRVQGRWKAATQQPLDLANDPLKRQGAADWFTERLPCWARGSAGLMAVFLLYAQDECMAHGVYRQHDVFKLLGIRATSGSQPFGPPARVPHQQLPAEVNEALARAVRHALHRLGPAGPALPRGVVQLDGAAGEGGLSLALGSCQYPPGIVNQEPGYESWRALAASASPPDLVVLTGDQVYADATAGLFDPALLDDRYRKPYEHWLRSEPVGDVLRRVPMATAPDDHEIDDNWEPVDRDNPPGVWEQNEERRRCGVEGFFRFQRGLDARQQQPLPTEPLWFRFRKGGVPFFMLDTRTERALRSSRRPGALCTPAQWRALEQWLEAADRARPKVVVSGSLLLPRHRAVIEPVDSPAFGTPRELAPAFAALRSDGWDGFPELERLLTFVAEQGIRGLVFLSGDEHLGLHTRITLDAGVVVHSIHSPGLNTPYRFANASRADFVFDETFRVGSHECKVETNVFDGAGFVDVSIVRDAQEAWRLRAQFPAGAPIDEPLLP